MNKLTIMASAAVLALSMAAPAEATRWGSSSWGGGSSGKPSSSTSGGHSSTSSGGHTSSGSTSVPEPGQLGLFAAGTVLLAARRFRRKG